MFRQTYLAALAALAAVASFTASARSEEAKTTSGTRQITNSIGMKLTLVPSGEFMMGSKESAEEEAKFFNKKYGSDKLKANAFSNPELTAEYFKDEHPQHRVRITKPFYLGTHHVTRGQFRQFAKDSGYKADRESGAIGWDAEKKTLWADPKFSWRDTGFQDSDEHPVVNVTWNDAVAFCEWLSKKEGKTYRLPTEAEWEYACRAGTTTRYYSGDDPETLAKVGNVADSVYKEKFPEDKYAIKAKDGYAFTAPVGQFKPNAFGLYDMHGNAWQLCADVPRRYDDAKSPVDDPRGPVSGAVRVARGGSWGDEAWRARSATRFLVPRGSDDVTIGFRVARTP